MPSIISAGTTTGTALSLTSDTSGELQIRTNNGSTTAMTLTTAGGVGIGTTTPTRQFSIFAPTVSAEMAMTMNAGQANNRTWNILVDGGNASTPNSFTTRLLDDSGLGKNTGFNINGSTGILRTGASTEYRGISAGSVPVGSVIQTQWNNFTVSYTGASASYVQVTAFNQTFTPLYASSKVYVTFNTGINLICDGSVALTRNGSIIKDTWFGSSRQDDANDWPQASGFYLDSPGTTSTVTYGIQVRATGCGNVIRIGGSDNHQSFTFMEIAA
jgi:hypothetical protein